MTIVETKATGATTEPVGLLYVPADVLSVEPPPASAGFDPVRLADLMSACLAHERCGAQLYASVAGRSTDPSLRKQYEHYGAETVEHIVRLEELIAATGGDPHFVSPSARATEKAGAALLESTFLLAGSMDADTAEMAMLEAVMLAEAKDHTNWQVLAQLAARMEPGDLRTQFESVTSDVLNQEHEHYGWAVATHGELVLSQVASGAEPTGGSSAGTTDVSEATREELYAEAKELGIVGRSKMNKDELAEAVDEQRSDER